MSRARRVDGALDTLIDEITVDCHDEDEALTAFENAFEEDAGLPFSATVISQQVKVVSIGLHNGRRELIATCEHAERRHDIALLDVTIAPDPARSRLLAAYRRWVGAPEGTT